MTETHGFNETCFITFNFDEWFNLLEVDIKRDIKFDAPENLLDNLLNYANQLKDCVDGFALAPVGMYNGKLFTAEVRKRDTFGEIVEYMKEVRQNNQLVFLYQVFEQTKRPKEIVVDDATYPQDLSICYVVRYGVLND
jgi:hypothetical protein